MLRKFLILHVFPFLAASLLIYAFIFFYFNSTKRQKEKVIISGSQLKTSGKYNNFTSDTDELDFTASILNKKQITLFGSSELSGNPLCPHNFLPDSLGLATLGVGHAYHQELSILLELLACEDYLEDSKISILLSPGWFNGDGTNTAAFIEFARPNFLSRILSNDHIESKYKKHLGKFISAHQSEMSGLTTNLIDLKDAYLKDSYNPLGMLSAKLRNSIYNNRLRKNITYQPQLKQLTKKQWKNTYTAVSKQAIRDFYALATNNDIYVLDTYYNEHLKKEDGSFDAKDAPTINIQTNEEYADFKLLVELLASRNADCSFIMQPLNPYYYNNLDNYSELMDSIGSLLKSKDIPFLNLFSTNKTNYEPGTLNDVMHFGDYGWMKVNYFLDSLYND